MAGLSSPLPLITRGSLMPALQHRPDESERFRLIPFRSPLLWESRLISFPAGTEMFHFPALAQNAYAFSALCRDMTPDGFPHSDISGSMDVWLLPEAYRSLPRLSSPLSAQASACCSYYLVSQELFALLIPYAIINNAARLNARPPSAARIATGTSLPSAAKQLPAQKVFRLCWWRRTGLNR